MCSGPVGLGAIRTRIGRASAFVVLMDDRS
jgi:hypothetical protein